MTTTAFGSSIIKLDSVDSTNNYAAKWLSQSKVPEGTAIMARTQWQGKGQRGNEWISEPGQNLTFSLVLYPRNVSPQNMYLLTWAMALGIADSLSEMVEGLSIKWPNDILVGGRKLAGILVENSLSGQTIEHSIIGAGININQERFPPDLQATSLRLEGVELFEPETFLHHLLPFLQARYAMLCEGRIAELKKDYLDHMFQKDVWSNYEYKGEWISACIRDVDENGRLILETESGTKILADLKEIRFKN